MTRHAELVREIDKLSPKYLGEVFDFVGYLRQKEQNDTVGTGRKKEVQEWRNPLYGLARKKGATLTLDRFMEMQREEKTCENENDQRLRDKK